METITIPTEQYDQMVNRIGRLEFLLKIEKEYTANLIKIISPEKAHLIPEKTQ